MNEITTVGVDLAKQVIAVCGADRSGKTVFTRMFRREAFAAWAVQLPPCVFGLEACGAAHYWARWLTSHGHTPRVAKKFLLPLDTGPSMRDCSGHLQRLIPCLWLCDIATRRDSWNEAERSESDERTTAIRNHFFVARHFVGTVAAWYGACAGGHGPDCSVLLPVQLGEVL